MRQFIAVDWFSSLITPVKYARYGLQPSRELPSELSELEGSIETLGLDVSSEGSSDSPVLIVYGAADGASVRPMIETHGFRVRVVETGYDMWMLGENTIRSSSAFALLMIAQFVGFGVVGWYHWRKRVKSQATSPGRALLIGLGLGVGAVTIGTLLEFVLKLLNAPVQEQSWVAETLNTGGAMTALFVMLIVVAGPLAEELFFRGFLFRLLRERATTTVAYVVSAALFAGAHLNPTAVVLYLLYGLVFAYALQLSGRLMTAVVAHSVVNLVAVVIVVT